MSELHLQGQICRFCQRNTNLAYYCENCGTSCCSDCLDDQKVEVYECQDCNLRKIEIQGSENKRICIVCGKDNIIKLTQYIKSCPKCHSQKIINIYEKKEKLEQKFLELIKISREFVSPFRDVINLLYLIRQKIKKARDPPIQCYHFPKMESKLLSLFKLIKYLEINLLERISTHFHYLASNKEYFFNIYLQPNSNIKVIEGILDNLNKSHESIDDFIKNNINMINEDINTIKKNLVFTDKITEYFSAYKRFINIATDEKPVYAIKAKLSNGLTNQDMLKRNKGILFITNLDLSFVQEYGLIKKKQGLIFKAPVDDLLRIKEKGKLLKKLYIEFSYGKYEFTLPNKVISRVIEYILLARNFDETTIYDKESARNLENINIDLNKLNNFIEDGINSFFSFKCDQNQLNNSTYQYNKYTDQNNPDFYRNTLNSQDAQYRKNLLYYDNNSNTFNSNQIQNSNLKRNSNYRENNYINPSQNDLQKINSQQYQKAPTMQFHNQDEFNSNQFQNNYNQKWFLRNPQSNIHMDNNNMMMKRLLQAKKYNHQEPRQMNNTLEDLITNDSYKNTYDSFSSNSIKQGAFQEYNRNHLSDLFNNDYQSPNHSSYLDQDQLFDDLGNSKISMLNLKKEKFSIHETLKDLDSKFDQGKISEVDYYRAFKHHKQEIYVINKKIQWLQRKIHEEKKIREYKTKFDNHYT